MSRSPTQRTVSQRLRQLDRRVLRESRYETAEGWTKAMSQWRWALVSLGIGTFALGVAILLLRSSWIALGIVPSLLVGAYHAGAMKTEHDRLLGSSKVLGRPRPAGL